MASLTLQIPDSVRQDAERRAAESGFESVEAYVASLVEQDTAADANLRELLSQRATATDAGEMGSRDFDAIRARVRSAAPGRVG
jgi:Arc/MetJ-type ribon-helix-helix transcriptional regulator